MPPPATEADSVAVVPAQIVALLRVTTGFGFTVTVVLVDVGQVPYDDGVKVTE